MSEEIEGFVPLALPANAAPAPKDKKKPGPPKGWRKRPDPSDPTQFARKSGAPAQDPALPRCPVCDRLVTPLSLEMVRELVQAATDRLDVLGEQGAQVAVSDVRYLAARLTGFCSLMCSQKRAAEV